jgi:hypothetical protein
MTQMRDLSAPTPSAHPHIIPTVKIWYRVNSEPLIRLLSTPEHIQISKSASPHTSCLSTPEHVSSILWQRTASPASASPPCAQHNSAYRPDLSPKPQQLNSPPEDRQRERGKAPRRKTDSVHRHSAVVDTVQRRDGRDPSPRGSDRTTVLA